VQLFFLQALKLGYRPTMVRLKIPQLKALALGLFLLEEPHGFCHDQGL
jgi:hypothetical protein